MHRPQQNHLDASLRIVHYLMGTIGYGVLLGKSEDLDIDGYTDADWASNPIDRKSTGGYFTFVGGNLVTWRSMKQKVVALSSAEAEFRGIKSGLTEIMWLRRLLTEIGFPPMRKSQLSAKTKQLSAFQRIQSNMIGRNMWRLSATLSRKRSKGKS